jgi:hypothetical protein
MDDEARLDRLARALIESHLRRNLAAAEARGDRAEARLARGALARHVEAHGSVWPPEGIPAPPTRPRRRPAGGGRPSGG